MSTDTTILFISGVAATATTIATVLAGMVWLIRRLVRDELRNGSSQSLTDRVDLLLDLFRTHRHDDDGTPVAPIIDRNR